MQGCEIKRNLVLEVAYDGTNFYGWQKTSSGPSIEGTLQTVLEQILQHPVALQAASRTDRGVHAVAQVVNFFTDRTIACERLLSSLNRLLPNSIAITKLYEAPCDFHPTLNVLSKEYEYQIWNKPVPNPFVRAYSWHVPQPLDIERMKKGASYLIGKHDFTSFCNYRKDLRYKDYVREIFKLEVTSTIVIRVHGDHFLYKMVRNIVGTLVYVGLHKIAPSSILTILHSKKRPEAGITAPAHGLMLKKITYTTSSILAK